MFRGISRLHTSLRSLPQVRRSITSPGTASVGSLESLSRTIWRHTAEPSPQLSAPCCRFSSRRRKNSDEEHGDDLFLVSNRDPASPPRLFVVQPRLRPDTVLRAKLSEALNLANSLEEQRDGFYAEEFGDKEVPPHIVVQNPLARSLRAHADAYFGPGTVETVKAHIKGSEIKDKLDAVFVNTILSGVQQRNLECAWEKPVLDRVGLIIEIFNAHAQTKEAKLQSELAALMYKKTRLVRVRGPGGRLSFGASGEAEVVSARGRGSGGRGFISGAGETELHLQRRRIQERRIHLLAQIDEVRRTRALQRSSRKRHGGSDGQGLATVAVVGYTNAGKSTLVSALSQSDVYSDDRLFATVDPRLRSVILPSGKKALLSDTVGFISDLPVQLVEAFHATLEEVVEADLLVHVLDSSAENLDEQRSTVLQVLRQIGVSPEKIQDMIEVWNKIDLLQGEGGDHPEYEQHLDESADWNTASELSADDLAAETDEINGGEDLDEEISASSQEEDLDDGAYEGHSTEEEAARWPSPGEPMDEDGMSSSPSLADSQDGHRNEFQECVLSKRDSHHVRTSAVLGVGLQELLHLIDEKLDAQKSFRERGSSGPFDRKWRPPQLTGGADS